MPALISSLWFEGVRLARSHQPDRRSGGGSILPSRLAPVHSGFQIATIEIGSAARHAQVGASLHTPEWQCVDQKELRR